MPRVLVSHESFFQGAFFEIADEIAISPATLLNPASPSTSTSRSIIHANHAFARGGIIGWTRLQADRLSRVKVACHSLNSSRDTTLLLLHG